MAVLDERLHALLAAARAFVQHAPLKPDDRVWRELRDAVDELADVEPCTCAAIRAGFDPDPVPAGRHHCDCPVTNRHPELQAPYGE